MRPLSLPHLPLLGVLLTAMAGALPLAHAGTNRTVTTTGDSLNSNDGVLSLREAIAASAAGDSIDFAITGTITLVFGDLAIARSLTIRGPGARKLTVSGNNAGRVFDISGAGAASISGLTLTFGRAPVEPPPTEGVYGRARGGAIRSAAPLTLTDCAITDSVAQGGSGGTHFGGDGSGGGIYTTADLTLTRCLVSGNRALIGSGIMPVIALGSGGGVFVDGGTTSPHFTAIDTTMVANGADTAGGGLASQAQAPTVVACTIVGNFVFDPSQLPSAAIGGLAWNGGDAIELRNTIVARNQGAAPVEDVGGSFISQGHNLIGDGDGASPAPWVASDKIGSQAGRLDPQLGPLQNNSGPTDTLAPAPSSAAINAGDDAVGSAPLSITTDQRGLPRRLGPHVDIGAYEVDVPQPGPSFIVNSLADPGDGIAGVGECTLREALAAANSANDNNVITFGAGLAGTITLAGAPLQISSPVNLAGPGARSVSITHPAQQILQVTSTGVSISGLTLRNSASVGADNPVHAGSGLGGAIANSGGLTLNACALLQNVAVGGNATGVSNVACQGGDGEGGAIYNTGALTLNNCTLAGNVTVAGGCFGGTPAIQGNSLGGAVFSASNATLSMTNCTFSGNVLSPGAGGGLIVQGGGVYNGGAAALLNSTVAANQGGVNSVGGGLANAPAGTLHLRNTLIAQNTAAGSPDVLGAFSSDGYNLIGATDGSSGWTVKDKTGTAAVLLNPKLSVLANNGGQTDTMALNAGSPALNAANATFAPVTDQRIFIRNGPPEIGAYEYLGFAAAAPSDESVTPNSGGSAPATARVFESKYRDGNGAFDIQSAFFLVNTSLTGSNALYCYFDGVNNKLYLRNNAGNAWLGGAAPGTAGSISDPAGKGALNTAGTTVTRSGNFLTIKWVLVPNSSFGGTKNLYMSALDKEGFAGGWDLMGTWHVNSPPADSFISPNSGSSKVGVARKVTAGYVDADGSADFAGVFLVVGTNPSGAGGIWCFYDAIGNKLYLRNNANTAWLGGYAPGSANVISQAGGRGSLDCAATTAARNATGLTVGWSLKPLGSFTGAKNLYLTCKDKESLSDGPDQLGAWTITP